MGQAFAAGGRPPGRSAPPVLEINHEAGTEENQPQREQRNLMRAGYAGVSRYRDTVPHQKGLAARYDGAAKLKPRTGDDY